MVASYHAFEASFDGSYFTNSAAANYYEQGGEPPGQWYGAGASALKLSGEIAGREFRRLLAGYHPKKPIQLVESRRPPRKSSTSEFDSPEGNCSSPTNGADSKLRNVKQKTYSERCPAFDITFSAPKSVSALWALGDEQIRTEVTAAIDVAVKRVLGWLEFEALLARSGKHGRYRHHAKLVIGMFDHSASRSKRWEPQLHRHAVIINACQLANGRWGAIDSFELRSWVRLLGPLFRVELANELKKRLGVELERELSTTGKDAGFHVQGIDKKLCRNWSSRRSDLLDFLDGGKLRLNEGTAQARQLANLLSRSPKGRIPPRQELLAKWQEEGRRFGLTRETVATLLHRAQPVDYQASYREAWRTTIDRLTNTTTDFTFRQLLQTIAEQIQHVGVDAQKLARRVKRDLKRSPDIVRLRQIGREMRFTTKENWELEEALLKLVEKMKARSGIIVPEKIIAKVLKNHPELDAEQRRAVRHLLSQPSSLRILTGVAGSGKSWALNVIREAYELAGVIVRGGAIAGQAKEELTAKAGVESRTVESYLWHLDKTTGQKVFNRAKHHVRQLTRAARGKSTWKYEPIKFEKNSVLLLDEAGMLDTRTLLRILQHADKANVTVSLVGDFRQLSAVGVGGPFPRLIKTLGNAHLSKNYRQKDAADVAAAQALREGDAAAAVENYVQRGRLTIGRNRRETIDKLVKKWIANGGAERPQDHFAFCETRAETRLINRLCQKARLDRQRLPSLLSVRAGDDRLYRGDRVMFHVACRPLGIENGYRGTIVAVNPLRGQITVRLDRKPQRKLWRRPQKQTITVPVKLLEKAAKQRGTQGITLGFAGTTHKLQGGSTVNSYMLVGSLTAREMAYTQATRGEKKTFVFVDRQHAGKDLKDLVAALKQSRAKRLAHDIAGPEAKRANSNRLEHSLYL
jgi:conjugative relaxase-like TrwC/TraI family protein